MADAALSALLSLASHELRGPAGVIPGLPEDARGRPDARRAAPPRGTGTRTAPPIASVTLLDEIVELARLNDQTLRPAGLQSMSLRSILNQAVQAVTLPPRYEVDLEASSRPLTSGGAWMSRGCGPYSRP